MFYITCQIFPVKLCIRHSVKKLNLFIIWTVQKESVFENYCVVRLTNKLFCGVDLSHLSLLFWLLNLPMFTKDFFRP